MARRKEPREIGEDTGLGIDIDGDGKSDFSISLKTIGMLLVGIHLNRYVVYSSIRYTGKLRACHQSSKGWNLI